MDLLEGFFLGPIWSDTEYETRRHTGFYWFVGWLTLGCYIWLQIKPGTGSALLGLPRAAPLVLFFIFLLGMPFACRYYYRLNILLKALIILAGFIKLSAAYLAFYQAVMPLYTADLGTLPQDLIEYVNQTIAKWSGSFESLGQGLGMIAGIVTGGLQVVLALVGILLAATVIPALFLLLIQLMQHGIDWLVHRYIYQDIDV